MSAGTARACGGGGGWRHAEEPGGSHEERMNPKTLKLIALGYVVKTVLFGLAWLAIPDLPERAMEMARQTWVRVTTD